MKLLDYIKGNRRGNEAHRIEKEAMSDPFLSEALEGFDAVKGDHGGAIDRLRGRVSARSAPRKRKGVIWALGAAAAVLLLFLTIGNELLFRRAEIENVPAVLAEVQSAPETRQDSTIEIARLQEEETKVMPDAEESVREDFRPEPVPQLQTLQNDVFLPEAAREESALKDVASKNLPAASQANTRSRAGNTVTGQVVDPQGQPLIGATVTVSGTPNGALTDTSGNFRIEDVPEGQTLIAQYIGFEPATVPASDSGALMIALNESPAQLDEVVVVGYGTERRSNMTGSDSANAFRTIPFGEPADDTVSFATYVRENRMEVADENGNTVQGVVTLEFRVNRQGRPAGIRVVKSLSQQADKEARRLLENGPDWKQADGRVRVMITL